jgi:hypothetical protein
MRLRNEASDIQQNRPSPVFAGREGLKFTFTLFGPAGTVGMDVISRYIRELLAATRRASELLTADLQE